MKRFLILSVLAVGLVAGSWMSGARLAAQEVLEQELPNAQDILDRETEATGGKAARQKINTAVKRGKISFPSQGMQGQFSESFAKPNKSYQEFIIDGLMKIETGTSGGVAWEKSSITGPRLLTGVEKAKALREADASSDHFKQAKTVAEEIVEGKAAYKVLLTTLEDDMVIAHFDKQTGLLLRQELTLQTKEGKMNMLLFFSDYRKVDGLLYPFTTRMVVGPVEFVMTIDQIEHNPTIPEERFTLPSDVQKLVAKQKG
jgi:hypothetical protein